jgi:hypothetical protein
MARRGQIREAIALLERAAAAAPEKGLYARNLARVRASLEPEDEPEGALTRPG